MTCPNILVLSNTSRANTRPPWTVGLVKALTLTCSVPCNAAFSIDYVVRLGSTLITLLAYFNF